MINNLTMSDSKNQTNANGNSQNENKQSFDMSQLISMQTNSAIIDRFAQILLANNLTWGKYLNLFRAFVLLLFLKYWMDESKKYLDNINSFGFYGIHFRLQNMFNNYKTYTFESNGDNWTYIDSVLTNNVKKNLIIDKFSSFLTSICPTASIRRITPNTFYFKLNRTYYISKIVIYENKDITIMVPKLNTYLEFFNQNIPSFLETKIGLKTALYKASTNPNNGMTFISDEQHYVFEIPKYAEINKIVAEYLEFNQRVTFEKKPRVFNFNGLPGTGKTTFGMYIATKDAVDIVLKINMMNFTKLSFEKIITAIRTCTNWKDKKDISMLIIFDEVDKWWVEYCNVELSAMRNKTITDSAQEKSGMAGGKASTVSVTVRVTEEDEIRKITELRGDFLNTLQLFADGDRQPINGSIIAIFNTNEFDSLFVDTGKTYVPLRSRFMRFDFGNIGKTDIINYVEDVYKEANKNKKPEQKEYIFDRDILEGIKDNIDLSYRIATHVFSCNLNNLQKFVELINDDEYIASLTSIITINDENKI